MGAFSTGGETTSGHGGLGMAPWTEVSLGILRQVDGDEDLAPRVFTIALSKKVAGGARGLAQTEGCSGLALLWHLFEVQMTG